MISRPPQVADKDPVDWIKEFLGWFEGIRFEFARVKTLWFPALYDGLGGNVHGTHPGQLLTAGNSGYISTHIPRETNEVREVLIRLIPTTTGTIDWTCNTSFAGAGADESASTGTATANGVSVTDDEITEIDVTDAFASVARNDQVGVQFTLDAVDTTPNIYLLGLIFKFR